ncbi:MAG: hypothetical protein Aurels2KO_09680 [Aureliella sp.]
MAQASVLAVKDLTFSYGDRRAVDAVSFEVQPGQVYGLLGPNGAGKTSAISCICGLLAGWSGNIQLGGQPFRPASVTADRAHIGLVPQELAIYPNMSAEENLDFFAGLSGVSKAKRAEAVTGALRLAGLADRRKDLVKTFSGGMQRRLNLASGLLHSPKLIVLDEPTVGVDPQSRNHLFEALMELKASGQSLLYTTHYMEEAEKLCDTVGIMNEGRIVASGTASELASSAGTPGANLEQVFLQLTGRKLRDE